MLNKLQKNLACLYRLALKNVYPLILLLCSFSVYFTYYGSPQSMFWDENYHIASAQKHIDHVMYMEPHPPLGKMLMALGEVAFGHNEHIDKHKFTETDYLKGEDTPVDMNYTGFRWPSVVLMAFSVLFFYGILRRITGQPLIALAFSTLIIFDNALVVHSRAAHLDGIQLFFMLAELYFFVRMLTSGKPILLRHYALLGVLVGLAISVKVTGAIELLLFVMLFAVDQWQNIKKFDALALLKRLAVTVPSGVIPGVLVFLSIFYIHIGMGTKIIPGHTYKASPQYLEAIREGRTWSPSTFAVGFADNMRYMSEYAGGVPTLDECKPDENGSFALDWTVGKKTINYRRDSNTVNGETLTRYITIVANPVVWFSALFGIILSVGLIMSRFVYGQKEKDTPLFYWICAFTSLYLAYMVAIIQIERVMYLYHYFIPLIFALINLALVFTYIYREEILRNNKHLWINLGIFVALAIAVFAFFAPLTYALPLNEDQFELRNWFSFWKLKVA